MILELLNKENGGGSTQLVFEMASTTSICNSILIGRLVIFFCDNLYVKKNDHGMFSKVCLIPSFHHLMQDDSYDTSKTKHCTQLQVIPFDSQIPDRIAMYLSVFAFLGGRRRLHHLPYHPLDTDYNQMATSQQTWCKAGGGRF